MFWKNNFPAILWAVLILLLCGVPGDKIPEMTFLEWLRPDKIAHLILFGVLSFLLLKGFSKQNKFPFLFKHASKIALAISITYGGIVEILQDSVFIHRSGDFRDAIANAIGAILGLWIYNRYLGRTVKG